MIVRAGRDVDFRAERYVINPAVLMGGRFFVFIKLDVPGI